MASTATQNAVTRISRDLLTRHLKASGFVRKGVHLYRQSADIFHGVNFQMSNLNSSDTGKFTINLVITSPSLFSLCLGKPFPSNPGSAYFPISERLGLVMPPPRKDIWWDVSPETDLDALSDEVCEMVVRYGLPFLDMYPDSLAILKRLRSYQPIPIHQFRPFIHAILAAEAGFSDEAKAILQKEVDLSQKHIARTSEIAEELGLKL